MKYGVIEKVLTSYTDEKWIVHAMNLYMYKYLD